MLFNSGAERINKTLNITQINQSVQRMKASVAVMASKFPTSLQQSIKNLNVHKETLWDEVKDYDLINIETLELKKYFKFYSYLNQSDEDDDVEQDEN
jgi:hypothetical protein